MKPRSLALRGLTFTFALYVFEALLAALCTMSGAIELAQPFATHAFDAMQRALLLESAIDLAPVARAVSGSTLLAGVVAFFLSPWLHMAWLVALTRGGSPLRVGSKLIFRAWAVSLLVLLATAIACVPFALIAYGVHEGLKASTDARFHDLALYAALMPVALILVLAWVVHDLARARALGAGAWNSTLVAMRKALRPQVLLQAFGLTSAGYGVVAFVQWQVTLLPAVSMRFAIVATALQLAVLARLFLRSLWLATALTCVHPDLEALAAPTE